MRIICENCNKGLYSYSEPEREDWENREMMCEKCGHRSSIKKLHETLQDRMPPQGLEE